MKAIVAILYGVAITLGILCSIYCIVGLVVGSVASRSPLWLLLIPFTANIVYLGWVTWIVARHQSGGRLYDRRYYLPVLLLMFVILTGNIVSVYAVSQMVYGFDR